MQWYRGSNLNYERKATLAYRVDSAGEQTIADCCVLVRVLLFVDTLNKINLRIELISNVRDA